MKRKRLSWGNRYKRFFLSECTALIAALASVLVMPVIYHFGTSSGSLDPAGLFDLLMRLLLILTLFYALRTHKLFLMQAATVGLLFCMLCAQSQYALGKLANQDSETYIIMGLQGFVCLCQSFYHSRGEKTGGYPGFSQPGLHSFPSDPCDDTASYRADFDF